MVHSLPPVPAQRRIFFVGVNTGYVTDGQIDDRFIDFYRCRSSAELYCAIVGNVVISGGYGSNSNTPSISQSGRWSEAAAAIKSQGSKPGIQLATAWNGYQGSRSFRSPSAKETISKSRDVVKSLGPSGMEAVLRGLDESATLAGDAGFEHLQVHAAHGYLINLLVDNRINADAKIFLDALSEWAERQSSIGLETSIRISLRSGDNEFDSSGREEFYEQICKLPFDFIDLSSGFYNIDKQRIYPARPDTIMERRVDTVAFAEMFPDLNVVYSGRSFQYVRADLPANVHIGICRDLIANPNFLRDQNNGCINAGRCHYYSRGEAHVTCQKWR